MLGIGRVALKLGKDRGIGLADKIGEHVEPATVRHADHKLLDAELAAAPQDRLERRHQRFRALDAKTLGAGVTAVEKPLERLGRRQNFENILLFGGRKAMAALPALELLLDPDAFSRHLDVHIFDADLAAVGPAQDIDNLAQTGALAVEDAVEKDLAIEIGFAKAVAAVIEFGIGPALIEAKRIEIGFEMPAHPIGADQLQCVDRVGGCLAQSRFVGRRRRGCAIASLRCRLFPTGCAQLRQRGRPVVADFGKKPPPAFVDRARVVEKAGIQVGDKFGVGAGEKTCAVDISHQQL